MIIQENIDLLPYNTFHFSCIARFFIVIKSIDEIEQLIQSDIWKQSEQKLILWWWSNMCFMIDTFDWIVVKNEIMWKKIIEETATHVLVEVGAGENRDEFVRWTIDQWRWWVENLVSIPGTVWAAPVQNIGAYGVEVKDSIIAVHWINLTHWKENTIEHAWCSFGYRDSLFKSNAYSDFFITRVTFRLEKINNNYTYNVNYEWVEEKTNQLKIDHPDQAMVWCVATAIASIRASKLPDRRKIGTAWSFFQNPIVDQHHFETLKTQFPDLKWRPTAQWMKLSAWQLIERVWLKWYTKNNVGVYDQHALVLVNYGNPKGSDLEEIINHIIEKTKSVFNVILIPEVRCFHSWIHTPTQTKK